MEKLMLNPDQQKLDTAVKAVWEMRKNNPTWPMSFICSRIANWHNVDYHVIMDRIRTPKPKQAKRRKLPTPEERYGNKLPYWNRD